MDPVRRGLVDAGSSYWRWYLVSAAVGDHAFSLQDLWIRLVIVVPLLALSGVAFAQSARHRDNERRAKKSELELAALGPYVALLPEADQQRIRGAMVEKFFGQPESITGQGV